MDKTDLKNLRRRYLIWLYKTTKEAFDRYERKFTQLDIDKYVHSRIQMTLEGSYLPREKESINGFIAELEKYIADKESACAELRQGAKMTKAEFLFLDMKLQAVEKAILKELGKRWLARIKDMYEKEMIRRILAGTENK